MLCRLQGLAVIGLLSRVTAIPASDNFASMPMNSLFQRDDIDFDANDLSFIKKIAAVGDSYSAGIGAGSLLARSYHGALFLWRFEVSQTD